MLGAHWSIPEVFACALAIRAVMFGLESYEKRDILAVSYQSLSKEVTSSTLSRSTFFWLVSLFRNGYQNNLTLDDLDPLDPELQTEGLQKIFVEAWGKGKILEGNVAFN